jgi:gliding motility-associated transport system permease protein
MRNVCTIYRREFAAYFNSPIAYIFICAILAIMSFFFFAVNQFFAQPTPDLRYYFTMLPIAFFIFIPAITMRLWSEEKRQSTIEMLMTLPLNTWEVVVGKFLASYTIVAIYILLTIALPVSLAFVLPLDGMALVACYLGTLLMAGVFIAIGSWISALTENQVVAFLVASVVCAVVCLLGIPSVIDWIDKSLWHGLGKFIGYFGTFFHYDQFVKGQIGMVGVIYCLSMIGLFLGLNNLAVESRKY